VFGHLHPLGEALPPEVVPDGEAHAELAAAAAGGGDSVGAAGSTATAASGPQRLRCWELLPR